MNKQYISLTLAIVILTGCGNGKNSPSSTQNDGEGSVDFKQYFPNTSMEKLFVSKVNDGDNQNEKHYVENINIKGNTITYAKKEKVVKKVVFTDKNITIDELQENNTMKKHNIFRHLDLGDTILSQKTTSSETKTLGTITTNLNKECKVKSKEKTFINGENTYDGDLLKIECIEKGTLVYNIKKDVLEEGVARDLNGTYDIYDTSYIYLKKDLGKVAYVNDDCMAHKTLVKIIDDRKKSSSCVKTKYSHEFYLDNI